MSLTNATFTRRAQKSGASVHIIVKLYDGTNYLYFSDIDMRVNYPTIPFIYGRIKGFSGIKEGFDWAVKSWTVSNVTITLANGVYRKDASGNDVTLSDDLADVTARAATVYLVAGESIDTFPDDCLTRFVGRVSPGLECDADQIKFTIIDETKFLNPTLPQNRIDDTTYPNVPLEFKDEKIPLVYGEFNITGGDEELFDYTGFGLCRAIPIDNENEQKFLVADHVSESISSFWASYSGLTNPAKHENPTLTASDSGKTTAVLDVDGDYVSVGGPYVSVYAMPEKADQIDDSGDPVEFPDDNGIDLDDSTYTEGKDTEDTGPTSGNVAHRSYWKMRDSSWLNSAIQAAGCAIAFMAKLDSQAGTPEVCDIFWSSEINQTPEPAFQKEDMLAAGSWDTSTAMAWAADDDTLAVFRPNYLGLYMKKEGWGSSDGTEFNQVIIRIYAIMLLVSISYPRNALGNFAACRGREYGSWITGRGSSYFSGFTIEDPSGIIESLLRDELSLATADIDTDSFTEAEDANVEARINLHSDNEMPLFDVIRQLAEQSTFGFFWSAAGKPYLIPMARWNTYTPELTIPASMIKSTKGKPDITFKKTKFVANRLNIKSRFMQEYKNVYKDFDVFESSDATGGKFGAIEANLKWPNVAGDTVEYLAYHYLTEASSSPGADPQMWAKEHLEVKLNTVGFAYAHLQPGNWIYIGSDVDAYVKPFGVSWASIKLLVTNIKITLGKTEITAIQLY